MTTERLGLELELLGELVPCSRCHNPIAATMLGWMHVDGRGVAVSWFCLAPHMTLASPHLIPWPQSPRTPDVGRADELPSPPARSTPPADWPSLPNEPWWDHDVAAPPEHRRPTETALTQAGAGRVPGSGVVLGPAACPARRAAMAEQPVTRIHDGPLALPGAATMQLTYPLAVVMLIGVGLGVFVGILFEKSARAWRDYQLVKAQVPPLRAAARALSAKAIGAVLLAAALAVAALYTIAAEGQR